MISLGLTIGIDSVIWKQFWLWPEGNVLYYNVILNKSSNWGTSPFFWYFYSAIPRAMFTSVFLIPVGVFIDRRTLQLVLPSLTFVFLYSFLPHKELRFIIYVFPLLNVAVAEVCKRFWENRNKNYFRKLCCFAAIFHIISNFVLSILMLYISSYNYPGGTAMWRFHELENSNEKIHVHISNFAAQTGVSRFIQLNNNWIYNKTENLSPEELTFFDHLMVESSDTDLVNYLLKTHKKISEVEAFSNYSLNLKKFPPRIKINFKPSVTIFKRNVDTDGG